MPTYIVCDAQVRMPQAGAADQTELLIEVGSMSDVCPVCFQPVGAHEIREGPGVETLPDADDDGIASRPWPP